MRTANFFNVERHRWLLGLGLALAMASTAQAETRWVRGSFGQMPPRALVGGHEANGQTLFICRGPYKGGVHPGKIRSGFNGCNIGYGGREVTVNPYDVLIEVGR